MRFPRYFCILMEPKSWKAPSCSIPNVVKHRQHVWVCPPRVLVAIFPPYVRWWRWWWCGMIACVHCPYFCTFKSNFNAKSINQASVLASIILYQTINTLTSPPPYTKHEATALDMPTWQCRGFYQLCSLLRGLDAYLLPY